MIGIEEERKMDLPAWARRIQQSRPFQFCVVPAIATVASTAYAAAHNDVSAISLVGIVDGVKVAAVPVALYVWGAMQHSPGSASFNPDGIVKRLVEAARK